MKKIAVLVSGNGSNLQALIDACKNKKIKNGRIDLVISSNEKAFALERAKTENIKSIIINKKGFKNSDEFNDRLLSVLKQHNPDLIVLAGFIHILSKQLIQNFENKIINVHPSLIPAFCGKGCFGINVHKKALERGVKISGATVHFVNEIPDDGPIIVQKGVKVDPNDTAKSLQQKIMEQAEWNILTQAVEWFCSNKLKIKNKTVIIDRTETKNENSI